MKQIHNGAVDLFIVRQFFGTCRSIYSLTFFGKRYVMINTWYFVVACSSLARTRLCFVSHLDLSLKEG